MNDVENEGVFVNSDGVEPTYTKWSTNEPSNSAKGNHYNGKDSPYDGEDFVIMNKGAVWNDIGNMNVAVICQLLCKSGRTTCQKLTEYSEGFGLYERLFEEKRIIINFAN